MSRRTTLPEPWASLARELGGVTQLAEACGVTTRTIGRWASGDRTPDDLRRRDVRERLGRDPWHTMTR